MTEIEITYEETDTKARYIAVLPGSEEPAELTVSKASPALVIADHTYVPEALRGTGVAAALAERLIADARSKGQTVLPLCPFVKGYAERHREEVRDVIKV